MNLDIDIPYHKRLKDFLEPFGTELHQDLSQVAKLTQEDAIAIVKELLLLACYSTSIANIEIGREGLVELPRDWLREHIDSIAHEALDLMNDEWSYSRLHEVYKLLNFDILQKKLIQEGLQSTNADIQESAQEWGTP